MRATIIGLCALAISSFAFAEDPEKVVSEYTAAMNAFDFHKSSSYFLEADCVQYKDMMRPLFQLSAPGKPDMSVILFGSSMDAKTVQAMPPCEFVARSLEAVMRISASMGSPVTEPASKILGSVKETDSVVHFLIRGNAKVGGVPVSSVEVVSVRADGRAWKVQMSEKMKGMGSLLAKVMNQQGGPNNSLKADGADAPRP